MSRIECPSEAWDRYIDGEERIAFPDDVWIFENKLDAYGHMTWTVGFSDECSDDNICDCPTILGSSKPVEKPEYDNDGACTKCAGRENRGDWLACFDFHVFTDPDGTVKVAYHVLVNSDSGGFIDLGEESIVSADKAPINLPDYWASIGMEHGTMWTEEERCAADGCNERWNKALKSAIDNELTTKEERTDE